MKQIKDIFGETHDYVTVCAGSIVKIAFPKWDGDKPETHIWHHIVLTDDACVCLAEPLDGVMFRKVREESDDE